MTTQTMESRSSSPPTLDNLVVVVGAGSTGSSTAYHLARSGQRVLVVDNGQIASGMTSRSTAIVRTHYSNEIVARMALYSLKVLRDFGAIGFSGFTRCGMLILAGTELRSELEANVGMLTELGINEQLLDKSDAQEQFPEINFEGCDYIAFEPESGYTDPVATASAYASKAMQLGAEFVPGNGLRRLEVERGRLESVILSDGTRIKCSKLILCTNVWTNKLLSDSGLAQEQLLPIRVVPHPVLVYKRPSSYQGLRPVVADYPAKAYYKSEGQSLLFGGSIDAEMDKRTVEVDNCPSEVPFEYVETYSQSISKRIPSMSEGVLHSTYIGMYDITPDEHPIIDELSELGLDGVFCCVGLSGHGFKLCPAFGVMNSEMVSGVNSSEEMFDRSFFTLSRFKSGKLFERRYEGLGSVA